MYHILKPEIFAKSTHEHFGHENTFASKRLTAGGPIINDLEKSFDLHDHNVLQNALLVTQVWGKATPEVMGFLKVKIFE